VSGQWSPDRYPRERAVWVLFRGMQVGLLGLCLLILSVPARACRTHSDCLIKECCPRALCVNKNKAAQSCPYPHYHCDDSYWPAQQACGCFEGTCQPSEGLYESYRATELEAMRLSYQRLDPESLRLCDQLHGRYLFECYRKVAEQLFEVNMGGAIRVCEHLARGYYSHVHDDLKIYQECFTSLALKLAQKNNSLAFELCDKAWQHPVDPPHVGDYRLACHREVTRLFAEQNLDKALTVCDEQRGYEREYCFEQLAIQMKNPALCEPLEANVRTDIDLTPDQCYLDMARHWKDETLCQLITDPPQRKYCLWAVRKAQ